MKRFAIIGSPLTFTLSPYIHYAFAAQCNEDILYNTLPCEKNDVRKIVHALEQGVLQGISVTAPYKEIAYNVAKKISPLAQKARAVNTLYMHDSLLCGDNTDIAGIQYTLQQYPKISSATILGSGATARSAIVALQEEGISDITLCARNASALKKLTKEYNIRYISWNKRNDMKNIALLINTIPVVNSVSLFTQEQLKSLCIPEALVFDVHYKPTLSPLLATALSAGLKVQNGFPLFVVQAQAQFQLFTEKKTNIEDILLELQNLFLE